MTTVPQARLAALAAAATTFHDLGGILAAIRQIASDRSILKREGRTLAVNGADASLAACVRRLCATAASSRDEAKEKVFMLERLGQIYHGGNGPAYMLMGAMVDAAVAVETEGWLTGTHRH